MRLEKAGVKMVRAAGVKNPFAARSVSDWPDRGPSWAARLNTTMFKLRAWQLVQYDAVVLMDTDVLLVRDVNWLMFVPGLAAMPEPTPTGAVGSFKGTMPNTLPLINIGVIALRPSNETFDDFVRAMDQYAAHSLGKRWEDDSFSIDQGFLNFYFRDVLTLLPQTFLVYHQTDFRFVDEACNLRPHVSGYHFMGSAKPWATNATWGLSPESFKPITPAEADTQFSGCAMKGKRLWWSLYHQRTKL
jgi:lipopolysaccharide biosynthesis glycosyltransferase